MPSGPGLEDLLVRLLAPLVSRRVPVRAVAAGPVEGVARVRWADGTTLLARSVDPGALTHVTRLLTGGAHVVAADVHPATEAPADPASPGVVVVLTSVDRPERRLQLLVLGLDQPD